MFVTGLIAIAVLLRLAAGINYFKATLKGQAKPSPVSWFFWGVTPLIAFAVQLQQGVGLSALTTLALGISPLAVFVLAIIKNARGLTFTRTDGVSAVFAGLGVVLWLVTNDAMLAMFFSIIGDIFSGVPTIIKSFKDPDSEQALPYFLSMISMMLSLLAIRHWTVASYAFPAYILLSNLMFFTLIYTRIGVRLKKLQTYRWRMADNEAQ